MFGSDTLGLRAGESDFESITESWVLDDGFDDLVYGLTEAALDEGWPESDAALPDDLDTLGPGVWLAALLHRVDRSEVGGYDMVRLLRARERLVAHYQAGTAEDMVEIAHLDPYDDTVHRSDDLWEYASDEIRAALHLTRYGADSRLDLALRLVERLPAVLELLASGSIDFHRARVIVTGTDHLDTETARSVVDQIVDDAPELTSGQLSALIRRLGFDTDPEKARRRYEATVEDRRVWIEQTPEGTGNLHALDLPIDRLRAIGRRLNGYTISLKNSGDGRTHDQLRADILLDLLDSTLSGPGHARGMIDMRVDLSTLAELDDRSAEIPGMGPVIADIARQVAAIHPKAEWRFTVTDQFSNPLFTGTTRRRPSTAHIRHLQSLHPNCVFPGCRMPAVDCDIDHNVPWSEGGPTSIENTTPKCRHDHILRHKAGWQYRYQDGRHVWASPLGHVYVTHCRSP